MKHNASSTDESPVNIESEVILPTEFIRTVNSIKYHYIAIHKRNSIIVELRCCLVSEHTSCRRTQLQ